MYNDYFVCLHLEDLHAEAARHRFGGPQPWDLKRPLFDLAAVVRHLRTYCPGRCWPARVYARDPLRAVYQAGWTAPRTEALFCEVATLTGDAQDVDLAVTFDVSAKALGDTAVRTVVVSGRAPVYPPLAAALARAGKPVSRIELESSPAHPGWLPSPHSLAGRLVVPCHLWRNPYFLPALMAPDTSTVSKLAIDSTWVAG